MNRCLKCGAPPPLARNLCHACFREATPLSEIAPVTPIECCRHCSARRVPGGWEACPDAETATERAVRDALGWIECGAPTVELALRPRGSGFDVQAHCHGTVAGVAVTTRCMTEARIAFRSCENCSRKAGGYFEATLQLRTPRAAVLEAAQQRVERALGESAPDFFATRGGAVRGGWDYRLSVSDRARSLARELVGVLGGTVTETTSHVGRRDGRELLRHTFAVRLPGVLAGDYLARGEGGEAVWRVARVHGGRADLRHVGGHATETVALAKLTRAAVLDPPREAQLVSRRGREALVLDPWTLETLEARTPEGWHGDCVPALRHGNATVLVWD